MKSTEQFTVLHDGELLGGDDVYKQVMEVAAPLNCASAEPSAQRQAFYGEMGVQYVPLVGSRYPSFGHVALDVDQTVQPTGAFKDRTMAAAFVLGDHRQTRRVALASAGNAGAAAARLAKVLGYSADVYCAGTASRVKRDRLVTQYGAGVHTKRIRNLEQAQRAARTASRKDGVTLLHPFDTFASVAGGATVGFELVDQLRQLKLDNQPSRVYVPVGGGGLLAGVACAVRDAKDRGLIGEQLEVVGVQMQGCDALARERDYVLAGDVVPDQLFTPEDPFKADCDGAAVRRAGRLALAVAVDNRLVHGIRRVTPEDMGRTMARVERGEGIRLEPAGALAETARHADASRAPASLRSDNKMVLVAVRSGANVDPELFDTFVRLGTYQHDAEARAYTDAMYALRTTRPAQPSSVGHTHTRVPASRAGTNVWRGVFPRS